MVYSAVRPLPSLRRLLSMVLSFLLFLRCRCACQGGAARVLRRGARCVRLPPTRCRRQSCLPCCCRAILLLPPSPSFSARPPLLRRRQLAGRPGTHMSQTYASHHTQQALLAYRTGECHHCSGSSCHNKNATTVETAGSGNIVSPAIATAYESPSPLSPSSEVPTPCMTH